MTLLTTVAQAMQTVFTDQAEHAARASGFCQRQSPLGGAVFAQAITFACLGNPLPTLDHFAQTAAAAVGLRFAASMPLCRKPSSLSGAHPCPKTPHPCAGIFGGFWGSRVPFSVARPRGKPA